jgi:hypothetical protein
MVGSMDINHLAWPFFDSACVEFATNFDRWACAELGPFEPDGGMLDIVMPSQFMADWVKSHFGDRLTLAWKTVLPIVRSVQVIAAADAPRARILYLDLETTGLSGGALPTPGCVVLSLARMTAILHGTWGALAPIMRGLTPAQLVLVNPPDGIASGDGISPRRIFAKTLLRS